ncbi:uncharacterized protein LOC142182210 [Nicotiana tabacum]|uniref:Uncharacterized protein LOC142182210 n=1 Tax=Nicotiana tabacum TaxID=4097 RepID=A0AC58US94_TOBAC
MIKLGDFEPIDVSKPLLHPMSYKLIVEERSQEKGEYRDDQTDDEGWILVTRRRCCKTNSQRESNKQLTRVKIVKKPKKKMMKKNWKKAKMAENHYQRLRCPVTLEDPRAFYEYIKALCCKIDEEETKNEDPSLLPPPLPEQLTGNSEEVDICNAKITFTNDDILLGETHHNLPLFMVGFVREQRISRILIDDGFGVNIHPIRTVKELGIPMNELCESCLMIQGFNQGGQRVIRAIKLEINMGDLHSSGVEKKIVADDKPFTEAESNFADEKFYLKNYVSKEGNINDVMWTKSVVKKVDITTSKEKITVEKDQVLHDRNKMNESSSSKKVTLVLRYVPKARKVEDLSSELQGFVKSSSHNSLLNIALSAKRKNEGFDPNAYKLLAKARYDPNEPSKLGKLPPEASNPTQKIMMEKGYPLKQSRERLGYKQPPPICISIKRASCNYITAKEVSMMLNKKPSVFDQLTKPRTSVFDRLGPLKKENKRHGSDRRIGAPIFAKKEILTTDCPSLIPSRMSVGSSYHITIHDEQNASSYTEVEEKCLDIHVCHHISFNDGDPQEDKDAKDAPLELEEGVKTTVDALKKVNLGVVEDPKPTYVSASLTNDKEGKYIKLLKELKDVFAWSYKEIPGLDPKVVAHHLAVRRVNKLIEAGFVREVKYPTWISSIVPVRKKNGQIRVCVDFRDLNNACPKDEFPLPIPEFMIDAMTGYEAISFMDGSSGYNQIRMASKDEELTAFRTSKGIYCYKVMPFGLKNAGATYQRAMQNIFDDMLHKNVECYVDDFVVKSRKKYGHLQDLRMVFERLRRYQLRMNPLKCAFGVTSGKFLGFIVRHRGIEIDQAKVDAILKMPEPKDIHELKRLTRNAFESIKSYLMKPLVLAAPIPGKPLILFISAQERSVGALLAQGNSEGKENALYYLSRMMPTNELKYSPIEKLCLALVFSIQKLKHYFHAHIVRLVSRANPIKFVMSKPVLSDRLVRWYLQFQQFEIMYVPQKAVKGQALADFLADHPIPDD